LINSLAADGTLQRVSDWSNWRERRPPSRVLQLDSAAAGRASEATLAAVADHARLEAQTGAYVVQDEAREVVERGRGDLAGLLGTVADGVAFVESAGAAVVALLDAWPLPAGAAIGVVAAEWGPNRELFERRGLRLVELATEPSGQLDLAALEARLATDPPAVVHLVQVTSHRALVQPVAAAAALCWAARVPLWVDAAQAVGHVPADSGADAIYGTSRKWLAGPRGIGFLAVPERNWERLDVLRPALTGSGLSPVRCLESTEAHMAGRVGLANAVRELCADGPEAVFARLAEVGRLTRTVLADVPGWAVAGPTGEEGAITGLRPTAGQDVATVRARLIAEDGILTTAALPVRAPLDMAEPLLRVSPHVDCRPEELDRLAAAVGRLARA
ncbi:MAG TPA: aminotransferase class V-fold PLP-dependent enzyme, partial [Jatrophihabitans sp.]|nr:aminotransferase class V-fold PLP-dependent enzyme [Jatrophihabitans sp.]